jgi:hypothetical protein
MAISLDRSRFFFVRAHLLYFSIFQPNRCQTQRSGFANLIKGQETTLTSERLKLLNAIGFKWVKCKTPGKKNLLGLLEVEKQRLLVFLFLRLHCYSHAALSWDERFEQVRAYF